MLRHIHVILNRFATCLMLLNFPYFIPSETAVLPLHLPGLKNRKQDTQFTYDVKLRRVHETIAVQKHSYIFPCVCVCVCTSTFERVFVWVWEHGRWRDFARV